MDKIIFRIRTTIMVPEDVLDGVDELAKRNDRSRNAEIVRILRRALVESEKVEA